MILFRDAFELRDGRLFWRNPPKNHAEKAGLEAGSLCVGRNGNKDYWHVRLGRATYKRSRVVFFMTHGRWPYPTVDHINGNSLDDRPENLREATYTQNGQNKAGYKKASGLPRGVSRYRSGYRAQIHISGKREIIGAYDSPEDASAAYEMRRKEAFREFA